MKHTFYIHVDTVYELEVEGNNMTLEEAQDILWDSSDKEILNQCEDIKKQEVTDIEYIGSGV